MSKMTDILYFGKDARAKIIAGVAKIANAVKVTMGPGGRFVVLAKEGEEPPVVTKDGVSISEYIKLIDPIEKMGAGLMKQSARKTVSDVGDGTTTATVLTQALVEGVEPEKVTLFRKGMDAAAKAVLEILEEHKMEDVDGDTLYKIALTSSNGDAELARLVSDLALFVGKEGIINVEMAEIDKTVGTAEPGFKFDQGIPTSQFISNPETGYCDLSDGIVLIVKEKLELFDHINSLATYASKNKKFLLVIAPEFSEEIISIAAENCKRNLVPIIPIKAPEFGDSMIPSLEDLAVYCDGDLFTIHDLKYGGSEKKYGIAEGIKSNMQSTTIIASHNQAGVDKRVKQLENLKSESHNKHDRNKLSKRIAQLSAGLATIKVGGLTEVETKERFDRYEDAVGACMAALKEGILPGGGIALAGASNLLELPEVVEQDDFYRGFLNVRDAINAPLLQILENADVDQAILEELGSPFYEGVDVMTGKITNMVSEGIVDPFTVTKSALLNAVSVANMILSIGCTIDSNRINIDYDD